MTPFGTTPFGTAATPGVTPGVTPGKHSRWDATPDTSSIFGGRTPKPYGIGTTPAAATPGIGGISGMTPASSSLQTPHTTPGFGVGELQTPATPEQFHHFRIQQEIDNRNYTMTDDEINKILDEIKGYEIVEPPAKYQGHATTFRPKTLATPTPYISTPGFVMNTPASQGGGGGAAGTLQHDMEGYEIANDPTLPNIKPEDFNYFRELIEVKDEEVGEIETKKRRMILKLILKVKNGTPPQRKGALRQLSDKARWFGPGALFDTILPLLMSPTLEDQERHLLVKGELSWHGKCVCVCVSTFSVGFGFV